MATAFLIFSIAINDAIPIWDLVSDSLNQRCRNMNHSSVLTEFDSKHVPAIRLSYYLQGYVYSLDQTISRDRESPHSLSCNDECFVVASIYIERVCRMHKMTLTKQNVHRLMATAVLITVKFHNDYRVRDEKFAFSAGLPLKGMMRHSILHFIRLHE